MRTERTPNRRLVRDTFAIAGLTMITAGCGSGAGSGSAPYYGANDPRQPFAPPSTVASAASPILPPGLGLNKR